MGTNTTTARRRGANRFGRVTGFGALSLAAVVFVPWAVSDFATGIARADAPATTRILVIGDSLTWQSQSAIEDRLADRELSGEVTVVTKAISGSGLASPSYFDWESEVARLVDQYQPDIVVVEFAGNCDPAAVGACGDAAFFREWERVTHAVNDTIRASGAISLWVTPIPMSDAAWNNRTTMINALLESMAATGETKLADVRSVFGGDTYTKELPRMDGTWVVARADDEVHLSLFGEQLLADAVLRGIEPLLG